MFVILSLISLSGMDQMLVQGYAWVTMFHDRAPEMGVSEALTDTFSGNHPCEVCLALAETTEEEHEDAPGRKRAEEVAKNTLATSHARTLVISFRREAWPIKGDDVFLPQCEAEVSTPPPERS